MKNKKVIFAKPLNAELQEVSNDDFNLGPDEILFKTSHSLISPGTELAIYKGLEDWAPLPYNSGYAAVGEVYETGNEVNDFRPGDIVFSHSNHKLWSKYSTTATITKVPEGVGLEEALFVRLASVSITALRVSPPELGDVVVVLGMGVIGNLAAQLFKLSGAKVIGVDICDDRLELAKKCGIRYVVNPSSVDLKQAICDLTDGKMAAVTVEATGVPAMTDKAFSITKPEGDVVLLGTPRGKYEMDVTPLLNKVHLWNNGCVSLKGAHEWRYPLKPSEGCKHSIHRNCEVLFDLIKNGDLKVRELITHVFKPEECQVAYQGLLNNKEEYSGVIFDWQNS